MRIITLATLSAALVFAVPATAKGQSDSDQPTAGQSAEKKVCKKLKVTGSRMGDRVCLTASEWKKVEEQK
ncbi:hypothetical protein LVY65_00485 [Sphingomonas sp. G124]|jgi:hypothetical protein|uniref:Uncharacterized protein n=1 Tax=Sphingomonas cremea TaxID=2904799 RepID=A0A9X1TVZ6_9SPHN|nr:hypothetical protein [Sphingomonas cremea]MCF2513550.1 hypothetical protein [Sphingomonas cremea]